MRGRTVDGPGPRDTRRYTITALGRCELTAWFDAPLATRPLRHELLLRVRCLHLVEPQRAVAFVRERRRDVAERLDALAAELPGFDPVAVRDPRSAAFAAYATLRYGQTLEQAELAWCDWLLDSLVNPPAGPRVPPG